MGSPVNLTATSRALNSSSGLYDTGPDLGHSAIVTTPTTSCHSVNTIMLDSMLDARLASGEAACNSQPTSSQSSPQPLSNEALSSAHLPSVQAPHLPPYTSLVNPPTTTTITATTNYSSDIKETPEQIPSQTQKSSVNFYSSDRYPIVSHLNNGTPLPVAVETHVTGPLTIASSSICPPNQSVVPTTTTNRKRKATPSSSSCSIPHKQSATQRKCNRKQDNLPGPLPEGAAMAKTNGVKSPVRDPYKSLSANPFSNDYCSLNDSGELPRVSPVQSSSLYVDTDTSTSSQRFRHAAVQTDLGNLVSPFHTSNRQEDLLKRRVEELEAELEERDRVHTKYMELQSRSRNSLQELLIEHSVLQRKQVRQRVMDKRLKLGQFVAQRHGSIYEEKFVDGWCFQELEKRRKMIELAKEETEKKRKLWSKKKPNSDKNKTPGKGKNEESLTIGPGIVVLSSQRSVPADEFFNQMEVFDLRKMMFTKEDKDIQNEMERLERKKNLHIREMKRIAHEDNSRFKDFPVLHNRYLILNLIGKGGFSEVHKGYDLVEFRYVACKVHQLNPAWPKEKKDNYMKHACREIEIHKTLNHLRIVKVFDVFDIDNDSFCTVLEYSEGNDLDFYLKQNKFMPEREAKSIVCQVVSALRYLNERKPPVIHYDLKPGNILLGSGIHSGEVKITDFGLSKLMTEDTYMPDVGMDLTSQGAGTYWYLPPECFETGGQPPKISSKVDVWSVGVIFYQCLFGRKPFGHNMTQADILHQSTILQAKSIHFPNSPKVSDAAKDFIRRCCTYYKEARPDVFHLANDDYLKPKAQLRHILDNVPLPSSQAPGTSTVYGAGAMLNNTEGPSSSS